MSSLCSSPDISISAIAMLGHDSVFLIHGFINFCESLFTCLSSRVKVDLDIVKKAGVVDDVSRIFCFQPFLMHWIQCIATPSTTIQLLCVLCHSGKIFGKAVITLLAYDQEGSGDMLSSATELCAKESSVRKCVFNESPVSVNSGSI